MKYITASTTLLLLSSVTSGTTIIKDDEYWLPIRDADRPSVGTGPPGQLPASYFDTGLALQHLQSGIDPINDNLSWSTRSKLIRRQYAVHKLPRRYLNEEALRRRAIARRAPRLIARDNSHVVQQPAVHPALQSRATKKPDPKTPTPAPTKPTTPDKHETKKEEKGATHQAAAQPQGAPHEPKKEEKGSATPHPPPPAAHAPEAPHESKKEIKKEHKAEAAEKKAEVKKKKEDESNLKHVHDNLNSERKGQDKNMQNAEKHATQIHNDHEKALHKEEAHNTKTANKDESKVAHEEAELKKAKPDSKGEKKHEGKLQKDQSNLEKDKGRNTEAVKKIDNGQTTALQKNEQSLVKADQKTHKGQFNDKKGGKFNEHLSLGQKIKKDLKFILPAITGVLTLGVGSAVSGAVAGVADGAMAVAQAANAGKTIGQGVEAGVTASRAGQAAAQVAKSGAQAAGKEGIKEAGKQEGEKVRDKMGLGKKGKQGQAGAGAPPPDNTDKETAQQKADAEKHANQNVDAYKQFVDKTLGKKQRREVGVEAEEEVEEDGFNFGWDFGTEERKLELEERDLDWLVMEQLERRWVVYEPQELWSW